MDKKELKSYDLYKYFSKEYDKKLQKELEQLDKEINILQIDAPKELHEKLSHKSGLKLKPYSNFMKGYKIASIVLIIVIISATFIITNPKAVTAVKNVIRIMNFDETGISLEIGTFEEGYLPDIPNNFELKNTIENRNYIRKIYNDNSKHYIEISLYEESYKLSLDNEKYSSYEEVSINNYDGKKLIKNDIITIVLYVNNKIIELESNLPENDMDKIIKTIGK